MFLSTGSYPGVCFCGSFTPNKIKLLSFQGKDVFAADMKACGCPGKGKKEKEDKINEQKTKGKLCWVSFQALLKKQIMKTRVSRLDR